MTSMEELKVARNKPKNFAYIDGANLYKAQKELGWSLDYF